MNIPTSLSARKTKLKKMWIQYIHGPITCCFSEHSVERTIDCAVSAKGAEVAGKSFLPHTPCACRHFLSNA